MGRALTRSGLAVVNAPFREYVVFSLRSKRFRAEDRGFLSEAGQFPFGKPLTGVARPKMFCKRPVCPDGQLHWYCKAGIAGAMHLVLCFFPCLQALFGGADLGSRSCGSHRSLWRYEVSRRPSACLTPER